MRRESSMILNLITPLVKVGNTTCISKLKLQQIKLLISGGKVGLPLKTAVGSSLDNHWGNFNFPPDIDSNTFGKVESSNIVANCPVNYQRFYIREWSFNQGNIFSNPLS